MRALIVAMAALALLFGCAGGVPQEKYDALAASCSKAANESASAFSRESAKLALANSQLSECAQERQSLQGALALAEGENERLHAEEAVLAAARAKADEMNEYNLAQEYYFDAFGPGKLPSTARLKKMDAQVGLLNDSELAALWADVKGCQSLSGCDAAKAKMLPYISSKTAAIAAEVAAIVGEGQH